MINCRGIRKEIMFVKIMDFKHTGILYLYYNDDNLSDFAQSKDNFQVTSFMSLKYNAYIQK